MTDKQIKRRLRYLRNRDAEKYTMNKYYAANKNKIALQREGYRNSLIDESYTLYYLPEEHYVGITNQLKFRMYKHKAKGKYVVDYEVIDVFKSKREALDAERYLHDSMGYLGSTIKYNNQYAKK